MASSKAARGVGLVMKPRGWRVLLGDIGQDLKSCSQKWEESHILFSHLLMWCS